MMGYLSFMLGKLFIVNFIVIKMIKGGDVAAVDLGGTNLRVGLVRRDKIIKFIRKPTPKDKNGLLNMICDLISEIRDGKVKGIGIGAPGPLRNGIVINPPNIPLKNFNLKKYIQKEFGIKCEVENDAKCAALAELRLGYGKGKRNFFVLTLGTGIGGGVVIDGKLYNKGDIGGELGSIYISENNTFEELASIKYIRKISLEKFGREINFTDLMKIKDREAKEIIDDVSSALARGIGSLINVFNPEIVVLAGGMRESGEEFLNVVRKKSEQYIFLPKKYDIVWSKLEEPGLLGAGLLID